MNATKAQPLTAGHALTIRDLEDLPDSLPKRIEYLQMPFEVWLEISDHHNYIESAESQDRRKYRKSSPASEVIEQHIHKVVAAVLDGQWYRISGHDRTRRWAAGELNLPEDRMLEVKAYRAHSIEDLNRLYVNHADPTAGTEGSPNEFVHEAVRKAGLPIQSRKLRHGYFSGALNYAIRGIQVSAQPDGMMKLNLGKAVDVLREEIEALDDLRLKAAIFSTGTLAAALISTALRPESIEVWAALNEGTWSYDPKKKAYDAAGAINVIVMQRKGHVEKTRSPIGHQFMLRYCLAVMEKHWEMKGKNPTEEPMFKALPRPIKHVQPLLEKVRKAKNRPHERDLFQPVDKLPVIDEMFDEDLCLVEPMAKAPIELDPGILLGGPEEHPDFQDVVSACRFALHGKAISRRTNVQQGAELIRQLESPLQWLNTLQPRKALFTPGLLGAALASLRVTEDCLKIWENLNEGRWSRDKEGDFDGTGILSWVVAINHDRHSERDLDWDEELFPRAMMVVKTWIEGWYSGKEKTYRTAPRALQNPIKYVEETMEQYQWYWADE
jgi:hypothetical protein